MNAAAGARMAALAAPPVIAVPSATGIDAQLVLAGPGARTIAFLIDWLIRGGLALAWLLIAALLILGNVNFEIPEEHETLWYLAGAIPATAIYFLYHPVLEPLMSGRTPGKRMTGLRVLTPDGVVPGVGALVTRNLFRIIDSMPALYVVGLLFVIFGRRHLRLGDMAAGTVLAVERAPFLEKLDAARGASADHAGLQAARRRAAALGRRRGSDVNEALAVVDDYRQAARALGAARTGAGDEYLEATYADLHDAIHRPARRLRDVLLALLRDRVPATMHAMRHHTLGVTMLFVISAVAGFWLIYSFPDLIAMFASPQLIATVERGELWTEGLLNVTPSAVLSVSILTNNIIVSLFAFCSGIVFGLGTFYLVGLNGISLGAIFAFTGQHGLAGKLFDFVIAHGCVELSCICIAGAAGSFIGEALIRPGARTRSEAFGAAARDAVCVLVVVTLLLFICGFIEGYISPDPEVPRWARVTIGVGYWIFMISVLRGYVFGRSRGGPPIRA
ncbi:MAG TPA: stage II sporulation protein M [Steroidobacteraceae bacterium]|nr:stage II sporulation protein M [Steroidobacteraceae bacterium]